MVILLIDLFETTQEDGLHLKKIQGPCLTVVIYFMCWEHGN